jgi:outer membrane receptor protein involved in Fe transport
MRINHFASVLLGLVLPVGAAFAQQPATDDNAGLEEVVVTAERRSENLQNVPVTVTAVSSELLETSHVNSVPQLMALVPSLTVIEPTGYTMAYIRGIGSSTLGGGTFSSSATYIDGIYVARTTNNSFELSGAESVQVLAGPQGSLYGRNATAGAIVITSRRPKPGDEFKGSVTATVGSFSRQEFSAGLSSGLGEKWAFSMNAAKNKRDGFVKNLNAGTSLSTRDMDDRDAESASGVLVFDPNDRAKLWFRTSYSNSNDAAGGGYEPVGRNTPGPFPGLSDNQSVFFAAIFGGFCANPAVPAACPFGPANTAAIAGEAATSAVFSTRFGETYDNHRDAFTNGVLSGTHRGGSALWIKSNNYAFNADIDFDSFDLKLATGYTASDYHGSVQVSMERAGSLRSATLGLLTGAMGPVVLDAAGGLGFSSINPSKIFSQSVILQSKESARVRWIGGVDYSKEDGRVFQTGDGFGASSVSVNDKFKVDSKAAFAQATIPFGDDRWSATVGGRFTDEEYSLVDILGGLNIAPLKGSKFTYTGRVERRGEGWLAYGGYSTGFKSGTLNASGPALGRAEPEEVGQFELGLKRDFSRRLRFNGALFFSTYKEIQLNIIDQTTGGNILTNGPKAEVKGFDMQLVASATDNIDLSLGLTALDAEFVENKAATATAPAQNFKGNKLPASSKLSANLAAKFRFPLSAGGAITFSPTLIYSSGKFYDQLNLTGSGGVTDKAYSLVNFDLQYKSESEHWTASLWGNNVLDEQYYRVGILAFGTFGRAAIAGNPANFGATLKYSF